MSKLQELINELCPDGVSYMDLGVFCKIQTGKGITSKDTIETGKYPVVSGGTEYMGYYNEYNREANTVTIARAGSAGYVNFINKKFYLNDKCFSIIPKDNTNTKYLYYVLKNMENDITAMKSTGSVPTVNTAKVSSISIPVPPLPVQEEIVRILDKMTGYVTELKAELNAELKARKMQYEYYRDNLLFLPHVPHASINKITLKTSNINWSKFNGKKMYIDLSSVERDNHKIINETVSMVSSENAPSRAKQIIKEGDIIFGTTRPMLKRYCIVPRDYDDQVCSTGYCIIRANQEMIMPDYIYHYLGTSEFYQYVEANQQGTSYPAIGDNVLKALEIPVPSLDMQKKIVSTLNRFDTVCNGISSGLSAEIDARQKQYEYYRDKLLSFKEISHDSI